MTSPRKGDVVLIKGEGLHRWTIVRMGYAVGVHYPLAWVEPEDKSLAAKCVPIADLIVPPVDLEDFPTGPI